MRRTLLLRSIVPGLLALAASPALGWGNDGHKIVCAVAYKLLPEQNRQEVDRLNESYSTPDGWNYRYFTGGCNLADLARGKARNGKPGWIRFAAWGDWHYLNLDRTDREFDAADCDDNCVLTGIEHHRARLADATLPATERAQALLFLAHWVGDVHQPLHVSYSDDRGGNTIDRIESDLYDSKHLHQVWDSGIIKQSLATNISGTTRRS